MFLMPGSSGTMEIHTNLIDQIVNQTKRRGRKVGKEKSAELELMEFVNGMETFLHPRITEALRKAIWSVRAEIEQEAKDRKVSRELQELEPLLDQFRVSTGIYSPGSCSPRLLLFSMRPVIRKIIELYAGEANTSENP